MTFESVHLGKLYIHATNIHQGGGKSLLMALIEALPSSEPVVLLLDIRMTLPEHIPENVKIKKVSPSILERFRAERWLAKTVQTQDVVLCFGNLPPLFKLRGRTVVFVQNRYLVDKVKLDNFSPKVRLRILLERFWLTGRLTNVSEFIVQTPTMKKLLQYKTRGNIPVCILPFTEKSIDYARNALPPVNIRINDYDFLYVASGEPHKNHLRLLEAWRLLAEEGVFPTLCLTLDETRFSKLYTVIDLIRKRHGLKIFNLGQLSHEIVLEIYKKVGALIYPSTFESFGLPLIEARQAGLPILASELDYVRDVLDPEQTFDPTSPSSIARAVKRFMGKAEDPLQLLDASKFVNKIVKLTKDFDGN